MGRAWGAWLVSPFLIALVALMVLSFLIRLPHKDGDA